MDTRTTDRTRVAAIARGRQERPLEVETGRFNRLLQVIGRVTTFDTAAPLLGVQHLVLAWLGSKKKGWKIGLADATSGRPWHMEAEDSLRAVSIESAPTLWAVRLDDPCTEIAGRIWRVELVLVADKDLAPAFGCTLSVLVPPGVDRVVKEPGVPAIIRTVAQSLGLTEAGNALDGSVWEVDRPAEVDRLLYLIESRQRSCSIVVVSQPRHGACFVDAQRLAATLAGLAIVVQLSADGAKELTERYGRPLGVFGDAVRLYRVGFDPDSDARFQHPLFIGQAWRSRIRDLQRAIKIAAMADTIIRRDDGRDVPSFGVIRQAAAESRLRQTMAYREGHDDVTEQMSLAMESLKKQSAEWEQLAIAEERRAIEALAAQQQTKARLYEYQARIEALEQDLEAHGAHAELSAPDDLDELADWVGRHFAGRIVITPRAARAVSGIKYHDVGLIYACIGLLAKEYRDMRVQGGSAMLARFRAAESTLNVTVGPTGEAVNSRDYKQEYEVRWEGTLYKLNMHLQGSPSRDVQRGLRIYFAWDDEQQLVVIGHLPTHLTNSLT